MEVGQDIGEISVDPTGQFLDASIANKFLNGLCFDDTLPDAKCDYGSDTDMFQYESNPLDVDTELVQDMGTGFSELRIDIQSVLLANAVNLGVMSIKDFTEIESAADVSQEEMDEGAASYYMPDYGGK